MEGLLNSAIQALRDDGSATAGLSDAVRAKLVQAAWAESSNRTDTYRPVMRPLRWLAMAGVVPVVLLVVAAILPRQADLGRAGAAFVGAEKLEGEIVFTIADGRGPHRVVRSTDASSFNGAASQSVSDGRYLDQANSGPVVVFYRID